MTRPPVSDPSEVSDEALMAALQAGDDAALAPLMHRWELGVKTFLLRLGVPSADVDDVAQEAFVRLYEKRDRYRPGAAFKPWMLTLAGNLGRNRLRWRFRRREDSFEELVETREESAFAGGGGGGDTSPGADQTWMEQRVRAAVNGLPDKLRRAVVCVDLEELSHDDAAKVIGCTAKAVETRLYRARHLLREACRGLLERARE